MLNKNLLLLTYILFLNLQSQELETLSYSHLNQGSIEVITDLHSNFVEDRNLEVWLPPNFNPESNYDLLIMHDGQNLFDGTKTWNKQEWKLDEWASKLIPEKKVKPFIIVGIYNSGENRWNDYFPENAYEFVNDKRYIDNNRPKLYANAYLKYIVNELIPFVRSKYLTTSLYFIQRRILEAFEKNSKTMQTLLDGYANESVDYSHFSEDVVFKGTLLGAPDSLKLDQIKGMHNQFFEKYDVKHMAPFNFLQGVNPDTGESDGSVRFYYDMQVTNSSNGKSVVIPIYESFDFDDQGKAVYVQWYCDWTASMSSLD